MDDFSKFKSLFFKAAQQHIDTLKSLIEASNPSASLDQLHLHTHSLKGEALAMQYKNYGYYATVIEKYLKSLMESHQQLSQNGVSVLKTAIQELQVTLQHIKDTDTENEDLATKATELQYTLGVTL